MKMISAVSCHVLHVKFFTCADLNLQDAECDVVNCNRMRPILAWRIFGNEIFIFLFEGLRLSTSLDRDRR